MKPAWYKLDGKTPVPATAAEGLALIRDSESRVVAQTDVTCCTVSTVFLAVDLRPWRWPRPRLFQTICFTPNRLGEFIEPYIRDYETWADAEAGHCSVVEHLTAYLSDAAQDTNKQHKKGDSTDES